MNLEERQTFEESRAGLPDVCPSTSVIWKPLHRLLGDGNPVDPTTILHFDLGVSRRLPFAAISRTRGNRLVFWPPSDARQVSSFPTGDGFTVHHVSLELSNGQTHLTRFNEMSHRDHMDRGWKLNEAADGTSLWLVTAFKIALLERQVGALEQEVRMPPTDAGRRVEEFRRYAASLKHALLVTPAVRGDYLVAIIYLVLNPAHRRPVQSRPFPLGPFWTDWVADWSAADGFTVASSVVDVGGVQLLVQTASPLGRLNGDCYLGSPTRAD